MELARKVSWVPRGARSVIMPLTKASKCSRSSGVMMSTWPVKPWRRALYFTRSLASGEAGPFLLLRMVSVFWMFGLFIFVVPLFLLLLWVVDPADRNRAW